MTLTTSLTKRKVFSDNQKILLNLVNAHVILTDHKPENMSVVDAYVALVVLKNATVHEHSLVTLQNDSFKRLGYKASEGWREALWRHLTWHDVVLWLMLPDLTEKFGYHPKHDELEMMKAVHETCKSRDERMYKLIYGILSLRLPRNPTN